MNALYSFCRKRFVALAILSYAWGYLVDFILLLERGTISSLDWKITQFQVNYFQFGFAKRALVGTILYPLFAALPDGSLDERFLIIALDVLCFAAILVVLHRVLQRIPDAWGDWLRILCIFSPLGFMQLSYDAGRYDHFNYLVLIGMCAFAIRGSVLAAGLLLTFGILVHEAVFFYGMPILLVAMRLERVNLARAGMVLVFPVAMMAAVVAFGNVDPELISALSPTVAGGAAVWGRGVLEPAYDIGIRNALIFAVYFGLLTFFAVRVAFASGNQVVNLLLPSLLCLPLFALGIDYFRWTHLTFVSLLAVLCLLQLRGVLVLRPMQRLDRGVAGALAVPTGPIGIDWGLPQPIQILLFIRRLVF